jgi:hypothetical protein
MVQTSVFIELDHRDYFIDHDIKASAFIRKAISEKIERDEKRIAERLNKEMKKQE